MKCRIEFHDGVLYLEYNITSLAELDQLISLLQDNRNLFGGATNPDSYALGGKSWGGGGMSRESGRELGKLGGLARAAKLTPERRSEIAKQAAEKRWRKIKIGGNTILGYD